MVGTNRRSFRVAEINAFGDLLPGILHHGMDTYEAQLHAWRPGTSAASPRDFQP